MSNIFHCIFHFFYIASNVLRRRFPIFSNNFTIAEPTITPSATPAIFFACSGVEMPNPIAHGILCTFG